MSPDRRKPDRYRSEVLPAHSRLLRWNDDGFHATFKIAQGHIGRRILELEIFRRFDGQLLAVIIGPRLAVDGDFPSVSRSVSSSSSPPVAPPIMPVREIAKQNVIAPERRLSVTTHRRPKPCARDAQGGPVRRVRRGLMGHCFHVALGFCETGHSNNALCLSNTTLQRMIAAAQKIPSGFNQLHPSRTACSTMM
jgi:hypothetical protein